jgi:hypothetical protein
MRSKHSVLWIDAIKENLENIQPSPKANTHLSRARAKGRAEKAHRMAQIRHQLEIVKMGRG